MGSCCSTFSGSHDLRYAKPTRTPPDACAPKCGVRRLDTQFISTNRPVVEFAAQDPFYFGPPLSARWGAEMMRAMDDVWANIEKSTFPFLIVHGMEDKLCSIEGSRRFVEAAVSSDKQLIEYPGLYHEVLTEVKWKDVLRDVMGFMNKYCPS
ncbi:putative monoglyceride lipase [Trypanosoma theileri]|uniref:Putative monoglyceride lipase n=1 Tax=Trypanosoma theileri TaxID=67003 RepID=A0A1X0NL50_9TRYP|nr:putative monoglyceride lipase [Trypanosoma theileri]ORC84830.1 putative monoglyceride lipase [Trypanosoma theileri]